MTGKDRQIYAIIIVIVFCVFIACGVGNFRAKQLLIDAVGTRLNYALAEIGPQIDLGRLSALSQNPQDPYYEELHAQLQTWRVERGWAGLYLVTKTTGGKWVSLLDSRSPGDPGFMPSGQPMRGVPIVVEKAYRGAVIQGEYYRTPQGARIGNFGPVGPLSTPVAEGDYAHVLAVLGVEHDASAATDFLYQTRYVQLGVLGLAALIVLGLARRKPLS